MAQAIPDAPYFNSIFTLIRRGNFVNKIVRGLGVRRSDVERVLEWYVAKM